MPTRTAPPSRYRCRDGHQLTPRRRGAAAYHTRAARWSPIPARGTLRVGRVGRCRIARRKRGGAARYKAFAVQVDARPLCRGHCAGLMDAVGTGTAFTPRVHYCPRARQRRVGPSTWSPMWSTAAVRDNRVEHDVSSRGDRDARRRPNTWRTLWPWRRCSTAVDRPVIGSAQSVSVMTRAQLQSFHLRRYTPGGWSSRPPAMWITLGWCVGPRALWVG